MSRIRTLLSTVVPSMLAGGLIFGSAFGHASAGRDDLLAYWPAARDATAPGTAKAGSAAKPPGAPSTAPRTPPPPPAPLAPAAGAPRAPKPPAPPAPPRPGKPGAGVSISFANGAIQLDGIKDLVLGQLDAARATITANPHLPKAVRDKVLARLGKVRTSVDKRMSNLRLTDLDKLGSEMEKMGEEIEAAMEGLDDDLGKLGDQLKRDLGVQLGKSLIGNLGNLTFDFDIDDDDAVVMAPGLALDPDDDLADAITDLKDLALEPGQRAAITKLRASSDQAVATAKKQLDELSARLHTALGNPATSDAEIARYVDQISAQEAAIRKARLLAWSQARRVLDDTQRKKIQDASQKKTR